jgi:hypothetical protein
VMYRLTNRGRVLTSAVLGEAIEMAADRV